jgi:hypothetical protein
MQSVPITTKVVSLNTVHRKVYSMQNYVIKFVSNLRQVGGFKQKRGYLGQYCMQRFGFMVFNATFNNISVISWQSVLLVEKTTDLSQVTDKLYQGSEILEVMHGLPKIRSYLFSMYDCHYSDFFRYLGK